MKPEVVVVGSSNTDMVIASKHLPRPGETVLGGNFYQAEGGKGANQAVAAARAGARVSFIGCLGSDALGKKTKKNLTREGIDLSHTVIVKDAPSGVALILVDEEGQNLISVAPGSNACLTTAMVKNARITIEEAKVLLLQLEVPLPAVEEAATLAVEAGTAVILNLAPTPSTPLPASFLEKISILIANEEEIGSMAGTPGLRKESLKPAMVLAEAGVDKVIVTQGRRGGMVINREGILGRYKGIGVKAIDSVGAGDCFCGWLAACLAKGNSFESSLTLAAKAAAISVTRRGAQPSLPLKSEVLS
jgi:ribokinase